MAELILNFEPHGAWFRVLYSSLNDGFQYGQPQLLQKLLENGAEVNMQDECGRYPLLVASSGQ
jgi:hypothetical protein